LVAAAVVFFCGIGAWEAKGLSQGGFIHTARVLPPALALVSGWIMKSGNRDRRFPELFLSAIVGSLLIELGVGALLHRPSYFAVSVGAALFCLPLARGPLLGGGADTQDRTTGPPFNLGSALLKIVGLAVGGIGIFHPL
jgi:hypothetical protein